MNSTFQPGQIVRHEGLPGRWRIESLAGRLPGRDLYRLRALDDDRKLLACELELVAVPRPRYLHGPALLLVAPRKAVAV